jgi:hypothetical protein
MKPTQQPTTGRDTSKGLTQVAKGLTQVRAGLKVQTQIKAGPNCNSCHPT